MRVQPPGRLAVDGCKAAGRMLRAGSGVVGRRTFEDAAIGDHWPLSVPREPAVRQCGAGRDDDVDSAAFVCPGPGSGEREADLAGWAPADEIIDFIRLQRIDATRQRMDERYDHGFMGSIDHDVSDGDRSIPSAAW